MSNLLKDLQEQYPLLEVEHPAQIIEEDYLNAFKINPEILPVLEEFITRYIFVSGSTHQGEIGKQLDANSNEVYRLKAQIFKACPNQEFAITYFGHLVCISIDLDAERQVDKIQIKFLRLITPPAQEAHAS